MTLERRRVFVGPPLEAIRPRKGVYFMLVLTRKIGQSIVIGSDVEVVVLEVRGEQVRIGIRAPKNVSVHRKEIYDQILTESLEPTSDASEG